MSGFLQILKTITSGVGNDGDDETKCGIGSCERRLWQLVASATEASRGGSSPSSHNQGSDNVNYLKSPVTTGARTKQKHITNGAIKRKERASIGRLAAMMRDILASPLYVHPLDEDPWASTHLITFPSDPAWTDVCYKKMLEKQRLRRLKLLEEQEALRLQQEETNETNIQLETNEVRSSKAENKMEEDPLGGAPPPGLHDWNILPAKPKHAPFHAPQAARLSQTKQAGPAPVTWTLEDIANAGRLLNEPPLPVDFRDEQDMRRVYTLIYDVFRYKNILNQCLEDCMFFREHIKMSPVASRVWLLLYDLYHRSFRKRTTSNAAQVAALFPSAGLMEVERILWMERVKLAAAIARIRIKNKALQLSALLPHHLRDEKSEPCSEVPLTCWVNIKKVKSADDLTSTITKTLNINLIDESTTLTDDTFKMDPHCPQFIIFHPTMRNKLVKSVLVRKNKLIIQDKSFCLGPATFVKVIGDLQLTGSVIQSHVNSPRTTAYLASILGQNDNIKKLLAFSAGNRKTEYENYFNDLGIKNISIFSEKMIDLPPDSNNFEEVIAVFATPPNSYSAVVDPIDLVCSRGGDLAMLEVLTETEDTPEGRKRVANILDEQKQTLKFAMSRPQIQFVLYETHSEIDAENVQMVQKTIKEINKYAQIHHAVIQGKFKGLQPIKDGVEDGADDYVLTTASQQSLDEKRSKALKDTIVPDCDLFNLSNLPDLCVNTDQCLKLAEKGCYLALMQRKQVTRMDNKAMIQMAENRGVFGADPNSPRKLKPLMQRKRADDNQLNKAKRKFKEFEVERLTTPTKASLCHSKVADPTPCTKAVTPTPPGLAAKVSQTRRWWAETTRHITNLRVSVSKQKLAVQTHAKGDQLKTSQSITTPTPNTHKNISNNHNMSRSPMHGKAEENVQKFVTRLMSKGSKVDEVVARSRRNPHTIPIHPKLRLTRHADKLDAKVPVPVAVTLVTFPPTHYW